MEVLNWLEFLAKVVPHLDKVDDLIEAAEDFAMADNSLGKWEAVKRGGDIAIPIFHEVTGLAFGTEDEALVHIEALKLGDGKLIGRLKQFYESPFGQMLLKIILEQLM